MRSADCPYTQKNILKKSLEFQPEIVIIKLGTNDAKEQNWKGKEIFKEEYRNFLLHYSSLKTNPEIYLCTPSTIYYKDGSVNGTVVGNIHIPSDNIREAAKAVFELGEELQYDVIDLQTFTNGHPEWFTEGLHPNATGAGKIAEEICRCIRDREGNCVS